MRHAGAVMASPNVDASGAFLRDRHHQRRILGKVLSEALAELVLLDPQVPVAVGNQIGCGGRRQLLGQLTGALPASGANAAT